MIVLDSTTLFSPSAETWQPELAQVLPCQQTNTHLVPPCMLCCPVPSPGGLAAAIAVPLAVALVGGGLLTCWWRRRQVLRKAGVESQRDKVRKQLVDR